MYCEKNRLRCLLMLIIWNLFKKPNTLNHNTCTQAKLVFLFYYSCYFHWRFSAIICYFPLFWGGSQSFTFNRFATNFCYFQQFVVDFPLLTDFSLFFHIFHYISWFSIFNRYPAIFCWFSNIYLPIFRIVCSYIYKGTHFLFRMIKT